jgi:hypothetical protein
VYVRHRHRGLEELASVSGTLFQGVPVLRKGASLLLAALLLAVGAVLPALDGGNRASRSAHIEAPGNPVDHGPAHNHVFCAIVGSTHGLPVAPAGALATHASESCAPPPHSDITPARLSFSVRHSRAPPNA